MRIKVCVILWFSAQYLCEILVLGFWLRNCLFVLDVKWSNGVFFNLWLSAQAVWTVNLRFWAHVFEIHIWWVVKCFKFSTFTNFSAHDYLNANLFWIHVRMWEYDRIPKKIRYLIYIHIFIIMYQKISVLKSAKRGNCHIERTDIRTDKVISKSRFAPKKEAATNSFYNVD